MGASELLRGGGYGIKIKAALIPYLYRILYFRLIIINSQSDMEYKWIMFV